MACFFCCFSSSRVVSGWRVEGRDSIGLRHIRRPLRGDPKLIYRRSGSISFRISKSSDLRKFMLILVRFVRHLPGIFGPPGKVFFAAHEEHHAACCTGFCRHLTILRSDLCSTVPFQASTHNGSSPVAPNRCFRCGESSSHFSANSGPRAHSPARAPRGARACGFWGAWAPHLRKNDTKHPRIGAISAELSDGPRHRQQPDC